MTTLRSLSTSPAVAALSNEALADGICTWAGRVASGEAELLRWIAEFDRREAWAGPGLLSCAHWLSWRIGLSPGAARERVRIARALTELPDVAAAFGAGRVSYSQVRAITRAAAPDDQQRWIELARSATAGQLEKLVRGVRRVRKLAEDAEDPERASWLMRARKRYDADGSAVYTIVLPAEESVVLDAALETVRRRLDARAEADAPAAGSDADVSAETSSPQAAVGLSPGSDVSAGTSCPQEGVPAVRLLDGDLDDGPTASTRATVAQALLAMAAAVLDEAGATTHLTARSRAALTAQVDPLSGWGRLRDGEILPASSLAAALRALPGRGRPARLRPLTAADLREHDLGRTQRLPSRRLRELVGTLDGERCRFPGCTRRRRLHAHHVVFWRDGGATDLANLILICPRHHTLVHAQGFQLLLDEARRLRVHTAGGVPVLHHPALPWSSPDELDPRRVITAGTLPPDTVEARLDLDYAVMVLMQQAS